ncbi:MAG: ATP-binding cassette domain-containing protein [Promethearchaeota archaeon]
MEIDDLITLKLFDSALNKINQLEGYDFYKYKAILYMAHSYFEESVSNAIEMWKLSNNPFQKLEYYLIRALIFHQSHYNESVQEYLQKFEAGITILANFFSKMEVDESAYYTHLLIQYFELKIELNELDPIQKSHFIDELLKIAPAVLKFQYELILLSSREEQVIREKLDSLIRKYDSVKLKPVAGMIIIKDLLGALYIKIGDLKKAKIQLESAMDLIGDGWPDIRQSLTDKISELNGEKKTETPFQYFKGDITLHGKTKLRMFSATYELTKNSYIITCNGKTSTYLKKHWYLSARSVRTQTYGSRSDWEREQRHSIMRANENPLQRIQQKKLVQAKLIEGKIKGLVEIGKGELITLRGPMGSGKSEIINYLLGTERPEKGEIIIDGIALNDLDEESMEKFRKNNLGLIMERRVVLPQIDPDQLNINLDLDTFIAEHPDEIESALFELKNAIIKRDIINLVKKEKALRSDVAKGNKLYPFYIANIDALKENNPKIAKYFNELVEQHGTNVKKLESLKAKINNQANPIDPFFSHCLAIFKLKPKLILMNEPFAETSKILVEKWLKILSMLAKHHEIAIVLETHHVISSFHADCQYFIRDHQIVDIIERDGK